jgi:MerR family redox-sensitive transcriptional activator SoxR
MKDHSPKNVPFMSIGAVAKRTGLRVSALRYYESAGLIAPARRVGGRRVYDDSVFSAVALVKLAQEAGFTVVETGRLIAGFDRATPASVRWQTMARRKLADVALRLEQAERMKRLLEHLLQCPCETLEQCVRARSEALRTAMLPEGDPSHH